MLFARFSTHCPSSFESFSNSNFICATPVSSKTSNISCLHGMCSLHIQKCWVLWCTLALLKIKHYLCIQKHFSTVLANSEHVVEKCFYSGSWIETKQKSWCEHYISAFQTKTELHSRRCESFTLPTPGSLTLFQMIGEYSFSFGHFIGTPLPLLFLHWLKLFPLSLLTCSFNLVFRPYFPLFLLLSLSLCFFPLIFTLVVCIGICWDVLCTPQALHKN